MNKKTIIASTLAGTVLMAGAIGITAAQSAQTAPKLTEEQAVEIALQAVPGEVVETELEKWFQKRVYEIEIRTAEGVITEVELNADSGEVLEIEIEDDDDDHEDDNEKTDT